ncbi:MAG: hypothetical protein OXH70_20050 [Acidobacteria bacterium]|nr:hypothetical protein [Acidobacteriota bacterium]
MTFAEEALGTTAKASIVEIKEERKDDDRRWIPVDLACEGCEAVPEGQCFDVIDLHDGPQEHQQRPFRGSLSDRVRRPPKGGLRQDVPTSIVSS